jgi:hypothetical protein
MNASAWELLIAAGIIVCAGWRVSLRMHPYAPCRRCQGRRGRNWRSTSNAWGNCGACGGSGRRKRLGAR